MRVPADPRPDTVRQSLGAQIIEGVSGDFASAIEASLKGPATASVFAKF